MHLAANNRYTQLHLNKLIGFISLSFNDKFKGRQCSVGLVLLYVLCSRYLLLFLFNHLQNVLSDGGSPLPASHSHSRKGEKERGIADNHEVVDSPFIKGFS